MHLLKKYKRYTGTYAFSRVVNWRMEPGMAIEKALENLGQMNLAIGESDPHLVLREEVLLPMFLGRLPDEYRSVWDHINVEDTT